MSTVDLLDQLAELKAASDVTRLDYENKRLVILQQVQAELDKLDDEYTPLFNTVLERIASLEGEIKTQVLGGRASVKGSNLQAVYMSPRVSWDTAKMDGFAVAHPELLALRKLGEPSVQIRTVK